MKSKLKYDDSLDVFGIHAIGGIIGAIGTGIVADPALGGQGWIDYTEAVAKAGEFDMADSGDDAAVGGRNHDPVDRRGLGGTLPAAEVHHRPASEPKRPNSRDSTSASTGSGPTTTDHKFGGIGPACRSRPPTFLLRTKTRRPEPTLRPFFFVLSS